MKVLNKTTRIFMIFAILGFCVGTLVVGISLHRATLKQNKTYTGSVDAVVIDYDVRQEEQQIGDDNETEIVDMYYPIFQYTVDGQEYKETSDSGSSDKEYEENTKVKIKYLPSDPSQFYIEGDKFRTFAPYILYGLSFISALVALTLFFRFRR